MVAQHYRWDFIGLSTDTKPTPQTSEKVVDGSTFYCSDTSKLYVYCKDDWYERKPLGGGGGGSSYTAGTGIDITDNTISVDTETIQPKLTAGSNISITEDTISATDTTYSNFVGTDGTSTGTAGLVPAPATTDAGKFLKADGTWDTAGGGGGNVTVLTTSDYNYPNNNPTSVALWLLQPGLYMRESSSVNVRAASTGGTSQINMASLYLVSPTNSSGNKLIYTFGNGAINNVNQDIVFYEIGEADGSLQDSTSFVTWTRYVDQQIIYKSSDPTSSSVAQLGQLWVNFTASPIKTFQCTENDGYGSYTWVQRW